MFIQHVSIHLFHISHSGRASKCNLLWAEALFGWQVANKAKNFIKNGFVLLPWRRLGEDLTCTHNSELSHFLHEWRRPFRSSADERRPEKTFVFGKRQLWVSAGTRVEQNHVSMVSASPPESVGWGGLSLSPSPLNLDAEWILAHHVSSPRVQTN